MEQITLHGVEGFVRKSGIDENGNEWVQFDVDYLAEQVPGNCVICSNEIESGFMCLDDGDEVCSYHVKY